MREDINSLTTKTIEPNNANGEEVEIKVQPEGLVPCNLSGRQHIGYSALLKSLRKKCFKPEYDFSKVNHGMDGHDAMEASLMQVELFPKLFIFKLILLM